MSNIFDIKQYLQRQFKWSDETFGTGDRTEAILKHITKELQEIRADPSDITEWVDVIQLAFDGARRAGHDIDDVLSMIVEKQLINEKRTWPDWRTHPIDQPIEHIKE